MTSNNGSNSISVLLGNGDGTFVAQQEYGAGSYPQSISIGDFNDDGKQDIAVANYIVGDVSILLNSVTINTATNNTFTVPVIYSVGACNQYVAVADFNRDGIMDVVAVGLSNTQAINIMLGVGDGTLMSPMAYSNLNYVLLPTGVEVNDFNRDNITDIVIFGQSSIYGLSILIGRGDGTFSPPLSYSVGSQPPHTGPDLTIPYGACGGVVADFNNDDKIDIVISHCYGNNIAMLLGNGDGNFVQAVNYGVSMESPYGLAATDFNGDGKIDIVATSQNAYSISILPGLGNGAFTTEIIYALNHPTTYGVVANGNCNVADFNGDGKIDIVAVNPFYTGFGIQLGSENGVFKDQVLYYTNYGGSSINIEPTDFNNDGKPDIVITNSNSMSIFFGNGDGTFAPSLNYVVETNAFGVAVADFNHDGKPDIVTANCGLYSSIGASSIDLFLNNIITTTTTTTPTTTLTITPTIITTASPTPDPGPDTGMIIGIVAGAVGFMCLVGYLIYKNKQGGQYETDDSYHAPAETRNVNIAPHGTTHDTTHHVERNNQAPIGRTIVNSWINNPSNVHEVYNDVMQMQQDLSNGFSSPGDTLNFAESALDLMTIGNPRMHRLVDDAEQVIDMANTAYNDFGNFF